MQQITPKDVQAFALDFKRVSEGHPRSAFPVLMRELLLQKCRVATLAFPVDSIIRATQAAVREIAIAVLAFQEPLLGMVPSEVLFSKLGNQQDRDAFLAYLGGPDKALDTDLLVFDWRSTSMDWRYLETLTTTQVLKLALSDASEFVTMVLALVLSDFGRNDQDVTTIVVGERTDDKKRILVSPPTHPVTNMEDWFYNSGTKTHYWLEYTCRQQRTLSLDAVCIDYEPTRSSVLAWNGTQNEKYRASEKQTCTREMADTLLDSLKERMHLLRFEWVDAWTLDTHGGTRRGCDGCAAK